VDAKKPKVEPMKNDQRFNEAIQNIDAANSEDPRTEMVEGKARPRELQFTKRVYEWIQQLVDDPSEELLIAARAHTLRRWNIPRDTYPKTTVGYHQWRDALAQFHAKEAESILQSVGYSEESIEKIKALIIRENWPQDDEACALEDADCLVFLETKLRNYIDDWGQDKTIHILQRTLKKMTPNARAHAVQLSLDNIVRAILQRAVEIAKV